MRIVFVRHGEPNYANDSLTEKGRREAELLSQRIKNWKVDEFYCSPLGRARETASYTLEKVNREAIILPWMREFSYPIDDPLTGRHGVPWDFVPSMWTTQPQMYDIDQWVETSVMKQNPEIAPAYQDVCKNFDDLLSAYGYTRDGSFYRVNGKEKRFITSTVSSNGSAIADHEEDQRTTPLIVIFCHLGVTCLVLSHLLNVSFPLLVHGFFLPTTSLTVLTSEERWGNEAYFRVQTIGDVHHLLSGGEPVSSAGSFAKAFQG